MINDGMSIIRTLAGWGPLGASPMRCQWRGLVRCYYGKQPCPRTPFGWRGVALHDWDALAVMPLWLYPFYRLKREWQRFVFEPLIRTGVWIVEDGDYYVNGKWAWPR